jgi:hypothetical protein
MALRQIDDRRLVEPLAGVGTSVEHLLDDPAEEIGAVGEPPTYTRRRDEQATVTLTCGVADTPYGENPDCRGLNVHSRPCPRP